jgi:hypothetical protein
MSAQRSTEYGVLEFTEVRPRACLGVLGAKIPWSELFPCFHFVFRAKEDVRLSVRTFELSGSEHVADHPKANTITFVYVHIVSEDNAYAF